MRERDVERYFVDLVKKAKGKAYKWASPGNRGVTDRIVFVCGSVWFVELKRAGGKLSPMQKIVIRFLLTYTNNVSVISTVEEADIWMKKRHEEFRRNNQ